MTRFLWSSKLLSRPLSVAWAWVPLVCLIVGGAQCTADTRSGIFGLSSDGGSGSSSGIIIGSGGGGGSTLAEVSSAQEISGSSGGFGDDLNRGDAFGSSVTEVGDLEGDGATDLAVGAPFVNDGGPGRGALWILFMDSDGRVDVETRISDTEGDFSGGLNDGDAFGGAVAGIGDLDGDGFRDLAVGAPLDDDGGTDKGAVWILFLKDDGTVRLQQKISNKAGDFVGNLDAGDRFGTSIANIGDLDGDGITDLAVGADGDDEGRNDAGAVWILFMNSDGTVDTSKKIARSVGGFEGDLNQGDRFGSAVAGIDDLNGGGVKELAVGADHSDDGGPNQGAVWILFLNADGTVETEQKISPEAGRFNGDLGADDHFGKALAALDDLDGDGVADLAVGADQADDGGSKRGAVWILSLRSDGRVAREVKISDTEGRFRGGLGNDDRFGSAVSGIGDLDGDGVLDLAVGAPGGDDGIVDTGALWILFLEAL